MGLLLRGISLVSNQRRAIENWLAIAFAFRQWTNRTPSTVLFHFSDRVYKGGSLDRSAVRVINFAVLKLINGNSLRFTSDKIKFLGRGDAKENFRVEFANRNVTRSIISFLTDVTFQRLYPSDQIESYR